MSDEFDLIASIQKRALQTESVPLGIGDDAAVIRHGETDLLVATDTLFEGVHFKIPDHEPYLIGRKALAVNLSDIAAMAGMPKTAFVTLGLRRELGANYADQLLDGMLRLAEEYNVSIAGGDTNIWDGPVTVGVTVTGEIAGAGPVTRSGAKIGDSIYVTGPLGGSYQSGRHLTFVPRVAEAHQLRQHCDLHAMIDVSDGLLADLQHLCEQSGVGATLNADAIPLHEHITLEEGLSDGEDFELLFTSSDQLKSDQAFLIGEITSGAEVQLLDRDGELIKQTKSGYLHQF